MILPAPLKKGAKIEVLDLSKDSFNFKELSNWFPKIVTAVRLRLSWRLSLSALF